LAAGWQVPPGIADATVPNPQFNLIPAATVDEGNNWVNMDWGPLSLTNPTVAAGTYLNYGGGAPLGNYGPADFGSGAVDRVSCFAGSINYIDAPALDFYNNQRKTNTCTNRSLDAGAVEFLAANDAVGNGTEFTVSPSLVDFHLVPAHSPITQDQDVQVINSGTVPVTFAAGNGSATITCTNIPAGGGCNTASFSIASNTCAGTTLAPGESCVINVVFNPNFITQSTTLQGLRTATLTVTPTAGVGQTVPLSGHDTLATVSVSPITPVLNPTPASTVGVTGTITITNTTNPNTFPDAGPFVPSAITLTRISGTGTFTLGGTCAVGTAINAGGTLVPPVAGSSCTITITYTPPVGATGTALNGSARLTVFGYGRVQAATTPLINTVYNAN
jgi:hypothetical protein